MAELDPAGVAAVEAGVAQALAGLAPAEVWAHRAWLRALLAAGFDVPEPVRPVRSRYVGPARLALYEVTVVLVPGSAPPDAMLAALPCLQVGVHEDVAADDVAVTLGVTRGAWREIARRLWAGVMPSFTMTRWDRRITVVDAGVHDRLAGKAARAMQEAEVAEARAARYRAHLALLEGGVDRLGSSGDGHDDC